MNKLYYFLHPKKQFIEILDSFKHSNYFSQDLILGKNKYGPLVVILGIASAIQLICIVYFMANQPIFIWDEAIYANNSQEMMLNHRYWVYTVNQTIDHYNTKPPFVLWLQAISFKLFSMNELTLRLPTLMALISICISFFVGIRKMKIPSWVGVIACFIFLTTLGAIRPHVFLTGDLDGMLVFCTTSICMIQLLQLQNEKISNSSILLMSCFILIGFLTKSFAVGLILIPIILNYFMAGKMKTFLKMPITYLSTVGCFLLITTYYYFREKADPGYFNIVWETEIKRYAFHVMTWNEHPYYYYVQNIITRFNPYYFVFSIVIGIPFFYLIRSSSIIVVKRLFYIILVYLILISIPSTKLEWYDAPIYPLWAFAISIMMYELMNLLVHYFRLNHLLVSLSVIVLLIYPIMNIIQNHFIDERILLPQEQDAALLLRTEQDFHFNRYTVLMDVEENKLHHFDALNFYIKMFDIEFSKPVLLKRWIKEVQLNDTLICSESIKLDSVKSYFIVEQLSRDNPNLIHIVQKK